LVVAENVVVDRDRWCLVNYRHLQVVETSVLHAESEHCVAEHLPHLSGQDFSKVHLKGGCSVIGDELKMEMATRNHLHLGGERTWDQFLAANNVHAPKVRFTTVREVFAALELKGCDKRLF
jgi:hypothetical protein